MTLTRRPVVTPGGEGGFRLATVPTPVVLAIAGTTVAGLIGATAVMGAFTARQDKRSQLTEDRHVAAVLAAQAESGIDPALLAAYSPLLEQEDQQATITRGSTRITLGTPTPRGHGVVVVRRPISGGAVVVRSSVDAQPDPPFTFTLMTSAVLVLVLGSALAVHLSTGRETRRQMERAVAAADQVATGDFSARVHGDGPPALGHFGRAFNAMAARLESVDIQQRQLLADLSHEIATPLTLVAGYATAVLDGRMDGVQARTSIDGATTRIAELLDKLAQLRALDVGPTRPTRVELGQVCADAAARHAEAAAAAGIALQTRIRQGTVVTDAGLVQTILDNLVTNAIRYTPQRGRVTISTRTESNRWASITVEDTGPGIPVEHQQKVFDRFYRLDPSRSRPGGGSGLGLAIANRAAHALGGHLDLDSTPGMGSTFRLWLPAHRAKHEDQRLISNGEPAEIKFGSLGNPTAL